MRGRGGSAGARRGALPGRIAAQSRTVRGVSGSGGVGREVSGAAMSVPTPETGQGAVTVSIVSHRHGAMVSEVLNDLAAVPQVARVILTLNVPEPVPEVPSALRERLLVVNNDVPA